MGSSLNKDQNVQIFMTLSKRMYYAGQAVQGVVHINCTNQRPYHYLNILIQGSQQCCWTETHGNTTMTYTNSKDTYLAEFNLAKFDLGIKRGHYNFPFSVLLPRAFPASMRLDPFNFIKYQISAHIPPYDQKSQAQIYRRSLHIRQPPRGIPAALKAEEVCDSQCCGCCCNCGEVYMTLQADVNHLEYGKIFHLRGTVNNTKGSIAIKNYKVAIREITKKVSSWEFVDWDCDEFLIHDSLKGVPKGTSDSFQIETKLPPEFTGYTAIGSIIFRTYYIALIAEAGCCISNPTLVAHTIITSSLLPELQDNEQRTPPPGWNPITAAPLAFVNIKPYIYLPSKSIDVRNQEGGAMQGQMLMELPSRGTQTLQMFG